MSETVPEYRRDAFGDGWTDEDGDSCDTREEVLERSAAAQAADLDSDGCRDDSPFVDVYTGDTISPRQAHVDHVLSLAQAWRAGAWQWSPRRREEFANDPGNLIATTVVVNLRKADDSPTQWKPPARSGWCPYAGAFRSTALRWQLPVSPADERALNDMCPGGGR